MVELIRSRKSHIKSRNQAPSAIIAIKSTSTPRRLVETVKREIGRSYSNRKLKVVTIVNDFHDAEPQEDDLNRNTFEFPDSALGNHALYGRFVLQFIGIDLEFASLIQVEAEFTGGSVQFIAGCTDRKNADGETVLLENIVGGKSFWIGDEGG
ncbi:BAHD acyltransferase DCR-like [Cucumis melo var. makuwa]|uniref:BAHD acyltransferase DCR-like n=1 Tax=Cucumis melo var. makuwa TaxID=1194695 RepID=A0A5D3D318_CUCMM|nr:BAHD acyltransferase DCR-like [Cucumis melo var. makuwa]TYK18140.1 BAHD acyltransferase DCR-like [Cucumis melo var. makuwa]